MVQSPDNGMKNNKNTIFDKFSDIRQSHNFEESFDKKIIEVASVRKCGKQSEYNNYKLEILLSRNVLTCSIVLLLIIDPQINRQS
jgi:hypothetical protein